MFNKIQIYLYYNGAEIDLIEEVDGEFKCFEFKFSERRRAKAGLKILQELDCELVVVNKENFLVELYR